MFLIRTAFWLSVVIFMIPVDEEAARSEGTEIAAAPIATLEAVGAAQAAFQDVGGFCSRNPDVCEVGGRIADTFALKARTGALMLYTYLDEQLADGDPANAGAANAGVAQAGAVRPDAAAARGTLTEADLAPAWNGPGAERAI